MKSWLDRRAAQAGFTLLEIVIALAIVSISVLAISSAMSEHTKMAAGLEQRLLASWVASNELARVRHLAKHERLRARSSNDTIDMGGRRWRARTVIEETDVERVFLVKVTVRDFEQRKAPPYAELTSAVSDSF